MQSLKGKTLLITGATDGLGRSVAERAAAAGAVLLLHGRNPDKGRQTVETLKRKTGNERLHYYNADFSSLAEVRKLSEAVLADHDALHLLLNNAAVGGGPKGETTPQWSADGHELRFAVSYLSHFLLTHNLLPLLLRSAPARIVNVASIGQSPLDFSDLNMKKYYDSFTAYARSKLAQIIWGFGLAEQLKDTDITVNSLHPASLMDTNMVHQFFGRVSSTVEEGVAVVEHVAFSAATAGISGQYFDQQRPARAHSQAYDPDARRKLWEISMELTREFRV